MHIIFKITEENLQFIITNLKNVLIGIFRIKLNQFKLHNVQLVWIVINVMDGWNIVIILQSSSKKLSSSQQLKNKKLLLRKSWQIKLKNKRKNKAILRHTLLKKYKPTKLYSQLELLFSRIRNLQKDNFPKEVIKQSQKLEIKAISEVNNHSIWAIANKWKEEKAEYSKFNLQQKKFHLFILRNKNINFGNARVDNMLNQEIQMEDQSLKVIRLRMSHLILIRSEM